MKTIIWNTSEIYFPESSISRQKPPESMETNTKSMHVNENAMQIKWKSNGIKWTLSNLIKVDENRLYEYKPETRWNILNHRAEQAKQAEMH